ncbi:hypothetical protein R1sor_016113 [Riccia sorocarpa]|uniref:Uncharacterized protein n=1 Tax=Riccia sorocarpa TaxID=122646 RepID=A0ABD3HH77_9MARC
MADAFQTFLYEKYRALYVSHLSELATDLDLLDILMIKDDAISDPVMVRVGSMLDLGTESSVEAQNELRKERELFWDDKAPGSDRKIFSWASAEVSQQEIILSSKSSVSGSLLAGVVDADLHFSKDSELKCKIGQVDTAKVEWQLLGNMVAKKPPRWQPDFKNWRIKPYINHGGKGGLHLVPKNTAQTVASKSPNLDLELSATRELTGTGSWELTPAAGESRVSRVAGKFMIAFRLVGFTFDSAGVYKSYEKDPGDVQPNHRASDDWESHSYQRAQIRKLYTEPAPDFNSDEDEFSDEDEDRSTKPRDLQRLPIVTVDTDGVTVLLDVPCTATPKPTLGTIKSRSRPSLMY